MARYLVGGRRRERPPERRLALQYSWDYVGLVLGRATFYAGGGSVPEPTPEPALRCARKRSGLVNAGRGASYALLGLAGLLFAIALGSGWSGRAGSPRARGRVRGLRSAFPRNRFRIVFAKAVFCLA